jgi:fucose 4-O-acetylase-like acetyltransferase
MEKRTEYVDLAAGIMIAWMILGHTASHASYEGNFLIIGKYLSFFMPWFFYKSGFFYKSKTLTEIIKNGAKKLIWPFVVYSLIGQFFYYICLAVEHNISFRSFVYQPLRCLFVTECLPGNGALWFLVVLYVITIVAPFCIKKLHPVFSVFIGVAIAFVCYLPKLSWFPCIIPNVAAGMAFYMLGYYCQDKENKLWMILLAIIVYAVCCLVGYPGIYFHHNSASSTVTYLLYYPASFAGIILLNNLCRWINPYLKYSVFRWIGENAMNIYLTNWIVLVLLRLIILDIVQMRDTTIIFIIYLLTMVITLPILNKLINTIESSFIHE